MNFSLNDKVSYAPLASATDVEKAFAGHTGSVFAKTTDGYYRVAWDRPNPCRDMFNLGRVFREQELNPKETYETR